MNRVEYEFPNSYPEKIEAIVYKRMYNTLRNEMDQLRGKKKSPNKLRKSIGEDSTLLVNEIETLPTEKTLGIFSNNIFSKTKSQSSLSPIKKKKHYNQNENKYIHCEYRHPGTFSQFTFKEKKKEGVITETFRDKTVYAWSCCMNNNKHSLGCEKIVTNKMKWNYESIP